MPALITNIDRLIHNRTEQAMQYLGEYWKGANIIIGRIDSGQLTCLELHNKLNAAVIVKGNIGATLTGSENLAVRQRMTDEFEIVDIDSDITFAAQSSNNMLAEMSAIVAANTVVTSDDSVGQIDTLLVSPETDTLRTLAVILRDQALLSPVA